MRQTDLEIYRWQVHNNFGLRPVSNTGHINRAHWKEHGAFVSVLPRQSGKSIMLGKMFDIRRKQEEDALVITRTTQDAKDFSNKTGIHISNIQTVDRVLLLYWGKYIADTHIFIDEFMHMDKSTLEQLLDWRWKSVTMVGTLK